MTDSGRKGVTDQLSDKMTPDSQKSTMDKASDTVSGAGDRVASAVQPDSEKSTTQKASDSARGGSDQGKGMLGQAQDTLSNTAQSVSDTLTGNKK